MKLPVLLCLLGMALVINAAPLYSSEEEEESFSDLQEWGHRHHEPKTDGLTWLSLMSDAMPPFPRDRWGNLKATDDEKAEYEYMQEHWKGQRNVLMKRIGREGKYQRKSHERITFRELVRRFELDDQERAKGVEFRTEEQQRKKEEADRRKAERETRRREEEKRRKEAARKKAEKEKREREKKFKNRVLTADERLTRMADNTPPFEMSSLTHNYIASDADMKMWKKWRAKWNSNTKLLVKRIKREMKLRRIHKRKLTLKELLQTLDESDAHRRRHT